MGYLQVHWLPFGEAPHVPLPGPSGHDLPGYTQSPSASLGQFVARALVRHCALHVALLPHIYSHAVQVPWQFVQQLSSVLQVPVPKQPVQQAALQSE